MQNFSRLVPLLNRVLIKKISNNQKTSTGIILNEDKSQYGVVVDVGPGEYNKNGVLIKTTVSIGQTVMIPEYGGQEVKIQKSEFLVFRESDLIAIVNK